MLPSYPTEGQYKFSFAELIVKLDMLETSNFKNAFLRATGGSSIGGIPDIVRSIEILIL